MRLGPTWLVAHKEILSTLRDRRAILSNLLIPFFLLPALMLGLPLLLGGLFERETAEVAEVGVEGLERLPEPFVRALEARDLTPVATDDVAAAVREGRFNAGLRVPAAFDVALTRGDAQLELVRKSGLQSDLLSGRLEGAVVDVRDELVEVRLRAAGLDPAVLEPVALRTVDASTPAERAGAFSWLVPFFIMLWTLMGGQMTAIDATAGEKERGTLEVLLVSPIRRVEVVVGKFVATLLFGLSAAVMAVLGLLFSSFVLGLLFMGRLGSEGRELATAMGGSLTLEGASVGALLVSSLLLAALVAALLMAVTLFARSYKEAQAYVGPLSLVLILPVVVLQFADFFELGTAFYAVPALGTLLLMDELVTGGASASALALAWGSSLLTTALLLGFALLNFRRERVLFRT
ncbi:ABC transporter permease [Truepera radiovictrix]|uniref:ABC-2 type transporter n=1 Tax=Truepera radiovictrix (strain DSM 17093 / CIP 108686 / LMG 22925 / RQ-24) TaxID=649638 RepID=D7CSN3_TRURR|nr:ABC transporter permease subunit [Truepera radiovictrix]ADI15453.1 ABC-2 type transporter [Truepera radiovictrix DSM 17093]WMT55996.1 ABC transporter permease subunit [Truepera radiovictrix]